VARKAKASKASAALLMEALRAHVRAKANDYLKDPNVTSVGVGLKNGDGPISLQFTVGTKASGLELEALDTEPIPTEVRLPDGTIIPTDVIERSYRKAFELVEPRRWTNGGSAAIQSSRASASRTRTGRRVRSG
jgi:endonuclease G